MKALFCHDHVYYEGNGHILSEGQFAAHDWDRYLHHFDALTVAGRRGSGPPSPADAAKMNRSDRDGVDFALFPDLNTLAGLIGPKRRQVRHADAALYVTRHFLQARYPSRAGIQAAASNVTIARADFYDDPLPNGQDGFTIGMIGSLANRIKGADVAIRAIALLRAKGYAGLRLRILGPGDPAPLQALAEREGVADCIAFDGCLPSGGPVYQWMRGLDLYIQPSFQEGVPRAAIEAMAQARPVIGSDAGGLPELLDPACIVRRGDAGGLADAVARMIGDPAFRTAQAGRNRREAAVYDNDMLAAVRFDFWQRVAALARDKKSAREARFRSM